jgi:hypothetical protein
LELTVTPLLQKIAEPIDYDDDILFLVSSIIKKLKLVSPTLLQILEYLPQVNQRNKFILGPLLETLCLYTMHH